MSCSSAVDPSACQACRLAEHRSRVVLPDGPREGVLAIGEAPGRQEDVSGVGFVGIAGLNLEAAFAACGLAREQWARSNIVRCRPPENRKPRADEVRSCAHWLDRVVDDWLPRVLLAVGQSAAARLIPPWTGSFLSHVERLLLPETGLPVYRGVPVVPMPHTSPLAWNRRRPDGTPIRELGLRAVRRAVILARDPT
ncbi:MAG: uracil-DNA glycosylase [Ectothiorhodospiraceae bacterium]|nr:uracil-DNA glycosylase [Ectothiorhodospiraceae bacterium]